MKVLCMASTELNFICKSDSNGDFFKSDVIDIKSNYYAILFHLALSIKMNPSFVILNNTILGMPMDKLQPIIDWAQIAVPSNDKSQHQYRQVIVVDRSENRYRTSLMGEFHSIHGSKVNGNPTFVQYENKNSA